MKSTIIKFGTYGLMSALVLFTISFSAGSNLPYSVQEALGYLTIALSLLLVFFGIRYYRDNECNGRLSFRNGVLIGLSITFFVAIGSSIADYVFVTVLYPDFVSDYSEYQLEHLRSTLSASEFEIQRQEMIENLKIIGKPSVMALVMFTTVMLMGIIISLLSSLMLKQGNEPV